MKKEKIMFFIRLAIALILIQTLRFKLLGHPDSIYIFTKVGLEPYGRIGIGIIELVAGILILIKRFIWLGSGITLGVISGAVFMHLTTLGIDIKGDGGILFYTAILTLILSIIVLWVYRKTIPIINKKI